MWNVLLVLQPSLSCSYISSAVSPLTSRRRRSPREGLFWGAASGHTTIGCGGCVCFERWSQRSGTRVNGRTGNIRKTEGCVHVLGEDYTWWHFFFFLPSQDVDIYISALYLECGVFYFTFNLQHWSCQEAGRWYTGKTTWLTGCTPLSLLSHR